MRNFTLALGLAAILPIAGQAQHYMGIATSNWSGTNSMYLNPANLADSKHKFSIDLFSVNFGVDNSLAKIDFSKVTKLESNNLSDALTFSKADQFSLVVPSVEVRGPGFMVNIHNKHTFALTTRVRAVNQFHNFNQNLYKLTQDSNAADLSQNQTLKATNFNWTAHGWSEINLGYGGVFYEKGEHMLKGGATVRYLRGAAYLSVRSSNINAQYNYTGNDATLTLTNTDFHYAQSHGNSILNADFNDLLKSNGSGFGADLGVVYEFRPNYADYKYDMDGKTGIIDHSKNQYLLRFSAAITDIGAIRYKKDNSIINFNTNSTTPTVIKGTEIADKVDDTGALASYLESRGMTAVRSNNTVTKVGMPTMLILGVDYHAIKGLYINATYLANVASHGKPGNTYYNQFTLTPRYDTRVFTVSLPITYSSLSSTLRAGVGVRVGGFFLGSDDLLAFGNRYSANLYFGAYVPFNKKRPRDSDHDLVSNRKDKCPNEKGVWEMRGCPNPDKDGDGILDKDDLCPDVAGSKTADGCPDADLDSVADAEDRCPEVAGLRGMQGCPDRDKDGIADIDDSCPDQAGLAQFRGCPDSDKDGIADNEDKCPDVWGPIANQGCPDSDNDGIPDNEDKCPTVAGTKANSGCPEVSVEVKKRLAFAATAIQFETGKAAIKKTSYGLLDGIVKILNDYPDYNMTIEGHSDNVGNSTKNLQLSKERANAVKAYFVSKGIDAARLSADGFGDTRPVASNKTAAGRAKNRRVAMDLKLRN